MRRITCASCDALQPDDWAPGDRCRECGEAVRVDAACAWCCHFVPEAKFCRDCGAEMVPAERFGVARMLKASGIDMFSLPQKTRELPEDHAAHFRSMYQRDLAHVNRRVEELRLAESLLLYSGRAAALEAELLPLLPLGEADRERLSGGPEGALLGRRDRLGEVAEASPLPETRDVAALSQFHPAAWARPTIRPIDEVRPLLLRLLRLPEDAAAEAAELMALLSTWPLLHAVTTTRSPLRMEALMVYNLDNFLHARAPEMWPSLPRRAQRAIAPLLALASPFDGYFGAQLATALEEAVTASDHDLAFAAALAGGVTAPLLAAVGEESARADEEAGPRSQLAAYFLAVYERPRVGEVYGHAHPDVRKAAVYGGLGHAGAGEPADVTLEGFLHVLRAYPAAGALSAQLRSQLYDVLAASAYRDDAERLMISQSADGDPAELIRLLRKVSGPDGDPQAVLKALLRAPLDQVLLEALARVDRVHDLGQAWVARLLDEHARLFDVVRAQANPRERPEEYRLMNAVERVVKGALGKGGPTATRLLRRLLPAILTQLDRPTAVTVGLKPKDILGLRNRYAPASPGTADGGDVTFSPVPPQLRDLLEDVGAGLAGFAASLAAVDAQVADQVLGRHGFWAVHRDAWHESIRAYPNVAPAFVSAWLSLMAAGKLQTAKEPYLYFAALWELLPEESRGAIRHDLSHNPLAGKGWYYVDEIRALVGA